MKPVTQKQLVRFVALTRAACYNYENKKEYQRLGRRILKEIAEKLNLKKGEFDIRFNPGGIACSGDHVLHSDKIYLALHDNIGFGSFYYRTCKGRKDFTGGYNRNVAWRDFLEMGIDGLVERLKNAQE